MAKYIDTNGVSHLAEKMDARFARLTAIAPIFSTSDAYEAGDYVFYNGTLYQFTADKPAGAWNASVVEIATLAAAVAETEVLNVLYVDDEGYLCTRDAYETEGE